MKSFRLSGKAILLLLLLFILGEPALLANQPQDTIWVVHQSKETFINHIVENGETLFMLSERFAAPTALAARMNDMDYSEGLRDGSVFKVPLGKFNYLQINSVVDSKPIYYQVQEGERLRTISHYFNVSQSALQRWNKLPLPETFVGQVLQVGWVKFYKTKFPFKEAEKEKKEQPEDAAANSKKETAVNTNHLKDNSLDTITGNDAELTGYSKLFYQQNEGQELQEQSGAAVFFTAKIPENTSIYYAFFDNAPTGTILSVFNPATKRVVYAKVIGSRPKIGKYQNALLGLSVNAAKVLQGKGARIFVKIKY